MAAAAAAQVRACAPALAAAGFSAVSVMSKRGKLAPLRTVFYLSQGARGEGDRGEAEPLNGSNAGGPLGWACRCKLAPLCPSDARSGTPLTEADPPTCLPAPTPCLPPAQRAATLS